MRQALGADTFDRLLGVRPGVEMNEGDGAKEYIIAGDQAGPGNHARLSGAGARGEAAGQADAKNALGSPHPAAVTESDSLSGDDDMKTE